MGPNPLVEEEPETKEEKKQVKEDGGEGERSGMEGVGYEHAFMMHTNQTIYPTTKVSAL